MVIIGDVHGKVNQYWKLIQGVTESLQLGDFGFKEQHDWFLENVNCDNHKVLFGNHDYYPYLDKPHSLSDYSYNPAYNLFTIRGANSIDKHVRLEGRDWFREEELEYSKFLPILDKYVELKPSIVVTHDCPQLVKEFMFGYPEKTSTNTYLQHCFEQHKPLLWIFGHYHTSKKEIISGTKFLCLDELETYKI